MYIDIHTHRNKSFHSIYNHFYNDPEIKTNPDYYFSTGLHPWHIDENNSDFALPENILNSDNLLAFGEAGLDKLINIPLKKQTDVFIKQALLSSQTGKPLIIHCVKFYYEILKIREDNKFTNPWIFHGFNEGTDIALKIVQSGCYLSLGGHVLHPSKKLKKTIEKINPEHIFFETDDSDISIEKVYSEYANIKGIELNNLQNITLDNFRKCFGKNVK